MLSATWTRAIGIGALLGGSYALTRRHLVLDAARVRRFVRQPLTSFVSGVSESLHIWKERGQSAWSLVESCRHGELAPDVFARLEGSVESLELKVVDSCAAISQELETRLEAAESVLRQDTGNAIHNLALEQ